MELEIYQVEERQIKSVWSYSVDILQLELLMISNIKIKTHLKYSNFNIIFPWEYYDIPKVYAWEKTAVRVPLCEKYVSVIFIVGNGGEVFQSADF